MISMYVLRGPRYIKTRQKDGTYLPHTGKPEGMYIRASDNLFTDNKAAAKLFDTAQEAADFFTNVLKPEWLKTHSDFTMYVVEVEVKPVVAKCGKTAIMELQ